MHGSCEDAGISAVKKSQTSQNLIILKLLKLQGHNMNQKA